MSVEAQPWSMPSRAALHLLCLVIPVGALIFLATAPHAPWVSVLWTMLIFGPAVLDMVARPERRAPQEVLPDGVFDATLWLLGGLQVLNVALIVSVAARLGLGALDTWIGVFLGGVSSASSIVVAHELVHRRSRVMQGLGRVLLLTVLYEHFYTEHLRGHHARVGTASDPATARYGERFWAFFARTVPAQFSSAWELESRRLRGLAGLRKWPQHRVLQGLVVGWGVVAVLGVWLGPVVVVYVAQALWAVVLLEAVNFVEHWGLVRQGSGPSAEDSWDSESWFTYYSLVGLSRHADHHANASRPYQALRCMGESAKMPYGYWACTLAAVFADWALLPQLDARLRAARLGPYRGGEA